jgi:hypothetical protein
MKFMRTPGGETRNVRVRRNSVLIATCFDVGFLLCLFFDLEEGGDMFLRNVP